MDSQLPAFAQAAQGFSWDNIIQVVVAALLGGLIGLEREARGREAGFRTNILIAIGACLFTILSVEGFPLQDSAARDSARVAAQIVSGVGFLGAGALFQTRNQIKGMTTAATIWLVAAIGMTVGVRAYGLAIFTSVLTFVVLSLLRPISKTVGHWKKEEAE
jgi:putative Mg2+ transporter-C (MgtC) family protein